MSKKHSVSEEKQKIYDMAGVIIKAFNENKASTKRVIRRVVEELGIERVQELYDETLKIEADGGMMYLDGSKRRTPGGVFLRLAKEAIPYDKRQQIFHPRLKKPKRTSDTTETPKADKPPKKAVQPQQPAIVEPPIPGEDISPQQEQLRKLQIAADTFRKRIEELENQPGKSSSLDITKRLLANTEKQIKQLN